MQDRRAIYTLANQLITRSQIYHFAHKLTR